MNSYETIHIDRDGAVAIVRFNRPDNLNSFNTTMRADFRRAIDEVNLDDTIRVVVLTGAGRAFCAGADLSDAREATGQDFFTLHNAEYTPTLMSISTAPKPWLSAINGAAAGIGSAYAMNCDLTVMADDAYLYQAFTAIGLIPDGGATWHLARTVGRKRAYELIADGEKLCADKCLAHGLCNKVVPAERLLDEALAWAQRLAEKAPLSLRYAKQSLNAAMEASLLETIYDEFRLQNICLASEDAAEGVQAFMEKRRPAFKGR